MDMEIYTCKANFLTFAKQDDMLGRFRPSFLTEGLGTRLVLLETSFQLQLQLVVYVVCCCLSSISSTPALSNEGDVLNSLTLAS